MTQTLSMPVVLARCRAALQDEIQAIRKKGSKPIILSDGQLLGEEAEGGYLYSFTLDAEIILPDDAPGKLSVGEIKTDAVVVSISGFTILLQVSQPVGQSVPTARLETDASFLLQRLRDRLVALESQPEAQVLPVRLFAADATINVKPDVAAEAIPSASLNRYQLNTVLRVATQDVTYVWGPPGTGKTTTLGQTVATLLRRGESVLVVAHSNAAVDAAALAVGLHIAGLKFVREGPILRVGVTRTPDISSAILPREIIRRTRPELIRRIESAETNRDRLTERLAKASGATADALRKQLDEVRQDLRESRQVLRDAERALVSGTQCVLCTLSKAALADEICTRRYDAVIVDEASMAYIPADIHVASLARRRVAIFGDFRQLPPITNGETDAIEEWLEPDIFEKANIVRNVEARVKDTRLVMLEEQYRMSPQIADVIARNFYHGRLKTSAGVEESCAPITARPPVAGSPVILMDTAQLRPFASKEAGETSGPARRYKGNSRFNLVSALVAVELARAAAGPRKDEESDNPAINVGIITPYAAQARLINKLLRDLDEPRERITCATVHRFQGSERDVIIYDTVESAPMTKAGVLLSGAGDGHGLEKRLLNVALSRARGKLAILANLAHLRAALPDGNIYRRILDELERSQRPVRLAYNADRHGGLATVAPLPGVTYYPKGGDHDDALRAALATDLRAAEIVAAAGALPASGASAMLTHVRAISIIKPTTRVYVGVAGAPALSGHDHTWNGPAALSSLVIGIDQRVLWIEGPNATLRIERAQTVKLLYSLWSLLPEAVRNVKTTEQQRELAAQGKSPIGRNCSRCGSLMWTAMAYGQPAWKCTNTDCGHSVALTADLATQLAAFMKQTCPECGGQLVGAQGSGGVYLRCMDYPKCKGRMNTKALI